MYNAVKYNRTEVLIILNKHIFIDQAGYLPDMQKLAVLNIQAESFEVINSSGEVCYRGTPVLAGTDSKAGEQIWTADFSQLRTTGRYHVRLPDGERSFSFDIKDNVYDTCLNDVTKAFYYLRCGCGLDEEHAGVFKHGKCHTGKALVWTDNSIAVEATGGWHDAGDYGRYVTAGACALVHLLYAYKLYPAVFDRQSLNIPESGGKEPDLLAECRVELDWLMKMQREDGAVYHKLTTKGHAPFIMPEEDTAQLYLLPPSSMATADTAAVLALASGVYSLLDEEYSELLLERALLSYSWLESNPDYLFENQKECTTGGYGEHTDRDNRFWAASELYVITGEEKYHEHLKAFNNDIGDSVAFGYGDMSGLGKLAYLLSGTGSRSLREKYSADFITAADKLAAECENGAYGCSLNEMSFGWGSNMTVLKNAMVMLLADRFGHTKKYECYAAEQIHYLLGKNPLSISYVSGCGKYSIERPHLRPVYADGIDECIPGMVSGGPNRYLSDPFAKKLIPEGTAPMKCFIDDYDCYSLNEITIYWNSPAVFVLAHFNS